MRKRTGPLTSEETKTIRENVHDMSYAELAKMLNRTENLIIRYIRDKGIEALRSSEEEETYAKLKVTLHGKPYWTEIKKNFFEDELVYFEEHWIQMVLQFSEDVWFAEELYLKEWITLDILKNRALSAQKDHIIEVKKIENELNKEYLLPIDVRDHILIGTREQQLSIAKGSVTQHTQTHTALLKEIKFISDKLKSNREERRDIKMDKDTYWGYLGMLEDETFRKSESHQAEIRKISQLQAKKRMEELHEFCDGSVDHPLLTPELVLAQKEQK